MKKFVLLLTFCSFVYLSSFAAEIYYSSGEGSGLWSDPASWVLGQEQVAPSVAPGPEDHVVIRHYIIHSVGSLYRHEGDIRVEQSGIYEVSSPVGTIARFEFSGDYFEVKGTFYLTSDLVMTGHSALIAHEGSQVILGEKLILDHTSGVISETNTCSGFSIGAELQLYTSQAFLTGHGNVLVKGSVQVWENDHVKEEHAEEVKERMGEGLKLYQHEEACAAEAPFILGENAALTPGVTWAAFEAESDASDAVLRWYTQSERFLVDYTVERSFDGVAFETVGSVAAKGNADLGHSYEYTDRMPRGQTVVYRIRQNLLSGTVAYSDTRSVRASTEAVAFALFPNPTTNVQTLTMQSQGLAPEWPVQLEVRATNGTLMHAQQHDTDYNGRVVWQGLPDMPTGLYIVVLRQEDTQLVQRLTIY